MKEKIVRFPSEMTNRGTERITTYRPTTRTETLIAVWLCGWAMLTAAECIRQINKASISTAQAPQPAKAPPIYVALVRPVNSSCPAESASPTESCNFSRSPGVLWLN
jgi:hypothetical protein